MHDSLLSVFLTLPDLASDVRSVGLAVTAPVPERCVSCQTLRQTDSNKKKGWGGVGCGEFFKLDWSKAKTRSAILSRLCFSSAVFTK